MDFGVIASKIVEDLRATAKAAWDSWSEDDRILAQECAKDAARIFAAAASGKDVSSEKGHLNAQLANLKVAVAESVHASFWASVTRVLSAALATVKYPW
jgi:hypothetical protein